MKMPILAYPAVAVVAVLLALLTRYWWYRNPSPFRAAYPSTWVRRGKARSAQRWKNDVGGVWLGARLTVVPKSLASMKWLRKWGRLALVGLRMDDRLTHVSVEGSSGTGKTTAIFQPMMLRDSENDLSVLSFDAKAPEQLTLIGPVWAAKGLPVALVDPDPKHLTHAVEPLFEASITERQAIAAKVATFNGQQATGATAFWAGSGARMLESVFALVTFHGRRNCSIPAAALILLSGGEALARAWRAVESWLLAPDLAARLAAAVEVLARVPAAQLEPGAEREESVAEALDLVDRMGPDLWRLARDRRVGRCDSTQFAWRLDDVVNSRRAEAGRGRLLAKAVFEAESANLAENMLASATTPIRGWLTPGLAAAWSAPEVDLSTAVTRPGLLILGGEPANDAHAMAVSLLVDVVIGRARTLSAERKNALIVYLDECPVLDLPSLARLLPYVRSYRIGFVLGYQNAGQLRSRFGADATTILDGCSTRLVFRGADTETASRMSEDFGYVDLNRGRRDRAGEPLPPRIVPRLSAEDMRAGRVNGRERPDVIYARVGMDSLLLQQVRSYEDPVLQAMPRESLDGLKCRRDPDDRNGDLALFLTGRPRSSWRPALRVPELEPWLEKVLGVGARVQAVTPREAAMRAEQHTSTEQTDGQLVFGELVDAGEHDAPPVRKRAAARRAGSSSRGKVGARKRS